MQHDTLRNMKIDPRHRFPLACLAVFLAWWIALAIDPKYRSTWFHENMLVFVGVPALVWLHRKMPFSRVSLALLTLFLCLHEFGAHYSYSEVPIFDWVKDQGGFERNHYDRAVHFSFGFLLAYPLREVFMRVASVKGFWSYYLPVDLVMAASMLFEIFEWVFVLVADPGAGTAYLGSQGDPWDAQKDMGLATVGGLLAMTVVMAINLLTDKNFRAEFAESLRVKRAEPLGEVELARRNGQR